MDPRLKARLAGPGLDQDHRRPGPATFALNAKTAFQGAQLIRLQGFKV